MGMLTDGFTWLHTMQQAYVADAVTLIRGASSAVIPAVIADVDHQVVDSRGATTVVHLRHFIIGIDKYKVGGVAATPTVGDTITIGGRTYTVTRLNGGDCWRYTDSTCLSYTVYSQLTAEA